MISVYAGRPTARLLSQVVFSATASALWTPPANTSFVLAKAWGADGSGNAGSQSFGGYAQAMFAATSTDTIRLLIGGGGDGYNGSHQGGNYGGGTGTSGFNGGGGGFSAVYKNTQNNAGLILVAGGAGAASDGSGFGGGVYGGGGYGGGPDAAHTGAGSDQFRGWSGFGAGGGGWYGGGGSIASGGPGNGFPGSGGSGCLQPANGALRGILTAGTTLSRPNVSDPDYVTPSKQYGASGAFDGEIILYAFSGEPYAAGLVT